MLFFSTQYAKLLKPYPPHGILLVCKLPVSPQHPSNSEFTRFTGSNYRNRCRSVFPVFNGSIRNHGRYAMKSVKGMFIFIDELERLREPGELLTIHRQGVFRTLPDSAPLNREELKRACFMPRPLLSPPGIRSRNVPAANGFPDPAGGISMIY